MNNGHITSTPRMRETAMNVNTNTTTVNTDTKETAMNANTDTKETIMNSDTNTDMKKNTSTVDETDIHTNTEHAFRLKGKNSLEVNPGYFASKFVKKRGLAFFKGDELGMRKLLTFFLRRSRMRD